MTDWTTEINRENALDLLAQIACPECGTVGHYYLFEEINNNGVGIRCDGCGKPHPFVKQRVMWLPGTFKRRSNDIKAVSRETGSYCYGCGLTFEELERLGIALHVHHTRPFADHGEQYKKIPMCSDCHEAANLMQRLHRRLLKREGNP